MATPRKLPPLPAKQPTRVSRTWRLPRGLVEQLAALKAAYERNGSPVDETAVAEMVIAAGLAALRR